MMDAKNYKILLVDDEPDILEFISYNLKKEGYTVLMANNGKEALKVAQAELPQLIVVITSYSIHYTKLYDAKKIYSALRPFMIMLNETLCS